MSGLCVWVMCAYDSKKVGLKVEPSIQCSVWYTFDLRSPFFASPQAEYDAKLMRYLFYNEHRSSFIQHLAAQSARHLVIELSGQFEFQKLRQLHDALNLVQVLLKDYQTVSQVPAQLHSLVHVSQRQWTNSALKPETHGTSKTYYCQYVHGH